MSTQKLYYADCHLRQFSAQVLSCEKSGDRYEIILDKTAFYPGGGGQGADTGTLGPVRVLDTRERGEDVVHITDGALEAGCQVSGTIDYEPRFDRMQQHTGEHIVSGILHRRFGLHNVGFHMGAQTVTVDFDGPVPEEALWEVEQEANRAIWENLSVKCGYPSPEELPTIQYRSKRALPWPVRIVEIPGYDTCACCGVHVERTGEAGPIKLLSCVKFKEGVRIEMVCGKRALAYLTECFLQNREVSRLLSAKQNDTAAAAAALKNQLAAEKYRVVKLQRQIFAETAKDYVNKGNSLLFVEDLAGDALRELTDRVASLCGGFAAVFTGEEGDYRFCIMGQGDLRAICKAMGESFGARGGGKLNCQQGTAAAPRSQIEDFFAAL